MPDHCAACGAMLAEGLTCQELHDSFLVFELANAIPHSVHFLMVTCFLIQHGRYSDEALVWARSQLQAHLAEQTTEQQLLHQLKNAGNSGSKRTWKFDRAADAPPLPKITWSMTIVDVAQNMPDAASYCTQVKQWAQHTLQEMKP